MQNGTTMFATSDSSKHQCFDCGKLIRSNNFCCRKCKEGRKKYRQTALSSFEKQPA